jgi:hypothetical protein
MQRVDTALLVQAAVVADTADLRRAHLRVEADMVDLRKDRLLVVATADLLRGDTAEAADSDPLPAVVTAEDSVAAVADSDHPAAGSLLLADRWVRGWATTSTRRCRSP